MNTLIIFTLCYVLGMFIGDVLLQDQQTRLNKNKDNKLLFLHSVIQSFVLTVFMLLAYVLSYTFKGEALDIILAKAIMIKLAWFFIYNLVIHFIIDYTTSRIAKFYYDIKKYWQWMNVIMIDGFLHLLSTVILLSIL